MKLKALAVALAMVTGCAAKVVPAPKPAVEPAPQTVEQEVAQLSDEELREQVKVEYAKLQMALFEEFANKVSIDLMEKVSLELGAFAFFRPTGYVISSDGGIGIATMELYVAAKFKGFVYIVAGHDGNEWHVMTVLTRTINDEESTVPAPEPLEEQDEHSL